MSALYASSVFSSGNLDHSGIRCSAQLFGSKQITVAMSELRRAPPRDIGELKTIVNAFAESLYYADVEKCVRHIRDRAREPALPKSAANLKEGSTD